MLGSYNDCKLYAMRIKYDMILNSNQISYLHLHETFRSSRCSPEGMKVHHLWLVSIHVHDLMKLYRQLLNVVLSVPVLFICVDLRILEWTIILMMILIIRRNIKLIEGYDLNNTFGYLQNYLVVGE